MVNLKNIGLTSQNFKRLVMVFGRVALFTELYRPLGVGKKTQPGFLIMIFEKYLTM